MEPTPFNGSGDASAWLTAFDERSKKKSPSWKMKRFEKLVEGEARDWWYMLRDADHWDILREMFVAYWVDGLRGERYQIKCKEVVSKASKAPISVNWVFAESAPPSPPPPKPEPSSAHPLFSVLVNTCTLDPRGIYEKAFAEFSQADDKEKIFRVLWDAAYAAGRQSGMGGEGTERKTNMSVAIDTSGLETPRILTSTFTQTPPIPPHHSVSVGMDTETAPAPQTDVKLDWAEDATSIPNATLFPAPSTRDFTILRSRISHPFRSLHRRTRRTHRQQHKNPFSTIAATGITNNSPLTPIVTHSHPAGLGPGRPMRTLYHYPLHSALCHKPLDWSGDPRLEALGQLLKDLGWVRA